MTAMRTSSGRFMRLAHDPAHPWVLLDPELRETVIRCATRNECREYQRAGGGSIVRTSRDRRKRQ